MSYTALYRKFRPEDFNNVKGQEHIVTTLKNQINADRIGHAYLFCGTRGTGKTSIAKIFAKAVNCEHPVDGSPCNECAMCKAINAGNSMNVIEIDAASNNGVDNIREIREEVAYSPTEGKYKVYIIDEVHMLSIGAFNALLKTLEEPPSYVIFILATTESHKIPVTILSRCQRYDFKRLTVETIEDRLRELSTIENIDIEDKALRYIAKMADGAMRDALSLLDQCVAFYMGKTLKYENVLEVLGTVDVDIFSSLMRMVAANDTASCIGKLEEIIMTGRDLGQFVTDFTWYMRNLLLVKSADDAEDMIDMSKEKIASLKEEATFFELEQIMRYIRIFSELSNQIKFATNKRVLIEIALIKLTRPMMENDIDSLIDRLCKLEDRVENAPQVNYVVSKGQNDSSVLAKEENIPVAMADESELIEIAQRLNTGAISLPGMNGVYQKDAKFKAAEDRIIVSFIDKPMAQRIFAKNEESICEEITRQYGKKVKIEIDKNTDSIDRNLVEDEIQKAQQKIKMPIIQED